MCELHLMYYAATLIYISLNFCKYFAALLERVLLRIGSAETDEQLQSVVSKFLPPVLLKLSSQQEGVRKKVNYLFVELF